MKLLRLVFATAIVSLPLTAAVINPIRYDMFNGDNGSYNYWDTAYTGSGNPTQSGSFLSGGLGELTDNVIATLSWEPAPNNPGPWVGWWTRDPLVEFYFGLSYSINSVTVHVDDVDGYGPVYPPESVTITIGSYVQNFAITDFPSDAGPKTYTFQVDGQVGNKVDVQFFREDDGLPNAWVFVSEVDFDGEISRLSGVPEPATLALVGVALCGLAVISRKRLAARN